MPRKLKPPPYEESVFVNCPFDDEFQATFDAIFLAIVCCGFTPRSGLEPSGGTTLRMERLFQLITESRFSIHDLSRCRGEGEELLARFNMPLELGMAMARRFLARRPAKQHDWMVLVPEGYLHQRFVSDLSGYDLYSYDGKPDSAVRKVFTWLGPRTEGLIPTPNQVSAELPRFFEMRKRLTQHGWEGQGLWPDLLDGARKISASLEIGVGAGL